MPERERVGISKPWFQAQKQSCNQKSNRFFGLATDIDRLRFPRVPSLIRTSPASPFA